ncbi:MAG: hypothetical protein LBJ32_04630 [Oscillospiraceae bacterium]|jgi:hypothetical protein|nr:hypothetical protein [Oscillospiraceae bacterium]
MKKKYVFYLIFILSLAFVKINYIVSANFIYFVTSEGIASAKENFDEIIEIDLKDTYNLDLCVLKFYEKIKCDLNVPRNIETFLKQMKLLRAFPSDNLALIIYNYSSFCLKVYGNDYNSTSILNLFQSDILPYWEKNSAKRKYFNVYVVLD